MTSVSGKIAMERTPVAMNIASPTQKVLALLSGAKQHGTGWMARCPAHDDHDPSLSVKEDIDGKVLLHCFVGCATEDIVHVLGLTMGDLFARRNGTNNVYPSSRMVKIFELAFPLEVTSLPSPALRLVFHSILTHTWHQ
jgi:hypothetical protein